MAKLVPIMKTTSSFLTLASSIAIPALAAWLIADGAFLTEILFGSYAIGGLCYIAANDYSRRQTFSYPRDPRKSRMSWTRLSRGRTARSISTLRTEKSAA